MDKQKRDRPQRGPLSKRLRVNNNDVGLSDLLQAGILRLGDKLKWGPERAHLVHDGWVDCLSGLYPTVELWLDSHGGGGGGGEGWEEVICRGQTLAALRTAFLAQLPPRPPTPPLPPPTLHVTSDDSLKDPSFSQPSSSEVSHSEPSRVNIEEAGRGPLLRGGRGGGAGGRGGGDGDPDATEAESPGWVPRLKTPSPTRLHSTPKRFDFHSSPKKLSFPPSPNPHPSVQPSPNKLSFPPFPSPQHPNKLSLPPSSKISTPGPTRSAEGIHIKPEPFSPPLPPYISPQVPPQVPPLAPLQVRAPQVPPPAPQVPPQVPASPFAVPARPSSFVLLPSGLTSENLATLRLLGAGLGARTVVNWEHGVTHVIVEKPRATRSLKYLCGLASGAWVVTVEWLHNCYQHRRWLPEAPYEVSGDDTTNISGIPAASRAGPRLFSGRSIHFQPPFISNVAKDMSLLVRAAGGALLPNPQPDSLIICDNNLSTEDALKVLFFQPGAIQAQWLVESISSGKLLDPSLYRLFFQSYSRLQAPQDDFPLETQNSVAY